MSGRSPGSGLPPDPGTSKLIADWILAQTALLGTLGAGATGETGDAARAQPGVDWAACERMMQSCNALAMPGSSVGGAFAANMSLGGFPAGMPALAHPSETLSTSPDWIAFSAADVQLRAHLAQAWMAAAAETAGIGHSPSPPDLVAQWATAIDRAFAAMVAGDGFEDVQTAWLRAALACGVSLTPPALPIPPMTPAIATTPKTEIWREGKITLSRYAPMPGEGMAPLLIVHGLIGRQTVTDLEPDRSLVADLRAQGADIWVMDWGNPDTAERDLDFTHYAETMLGQAVATMTGTTAMRPALMGICQGGVFVLSHAARHPGTVGGVALTGTPVDFHADLDGEQGYLNRLTRALPRDVIEGLIAPTGMLPGSLTGALFQGMTPGRTFAKYAARTIAPPQDPAEAATFARMEAWLADRPDLPGGVARQWLFDLFQDNALIASRFRVAGAPVDLGAIRCPVLNIVARADHIVPPACSRALADHLAPGLHELVETETGHIGVFASDRGRPIVAAKLCDWMERVSNTL